MAVRIFPTLPLSGRQEAWGRRSSELMAACPLEGLVRGVASAQEMPAYIGFL